MQRLAPALRAGQLEQPFHQLLQALRFLEHRGDDVAVLLLRPAPPQTDLAEAAQRGQGRAELVRGVGH